MIELAAFLLIVVLVVLFWPIFLFLAGVVIVLCLVGGVAVAGITYWEDIKSYIGVLFLGFLTALILTAMYGWLKIANEYIRNHWRTK